MKKMAVVVSIWCFLGMGAAMSAWGFDGIDVPSLKKMAEQGNPDAQSKLGVMYATGVGMQKDKREAVKWYKKAAAQGEPVGQWNLAFMYVKGEGGLEVNYTEARNLFRKSAEQGFVNAQYDLGIVLLDGVGGEPDRAEAITWFRKAAGQGYREAKKMLKELDGPMPAGK